MRCPSVNDLPPPPGAEGWPWTLGSNRLPDTMPDGQPWPLISIVTPSFNQGQFLEHAVRSVLLQGYPNLEFIVMDGGSSDDSVKTIRQYERWLTQWRSEPDGGPAAALNTGFSLATGDIFGFLNADDFYLPSSLEHVALAFHAHPSADVVSGHGYFADASGTLGPAVFSDRWNVNRFRYGVCQIIQQATFFRRSAFEKADGFRPRRSSTWDMELWAAMARAGASFDTQDQFLAAFRLHRESITGAAKGRQQRVSDALDVLEDLRGRPESSGDRIRLMLHRAQRFGRHPFRTLRQRLYFLRTLGRWSL